MGCDHITTAHQLADGLVSIHAPAWGATAYQYVAGYVTKFQSTHPRGVRLLPQIGADAIIRFQSTHPRGVRRRALPCWPASTRFQSTHPRGVRHASLERVPHEALVSIHAPAWGATGAWIKGHARMSGFNPRTRVGCDGTPAGLCPPVRSGFNPRTRVGCDVKNLLKFSQKALFQSTHPRGVRLQRHHHPTKGNTGFNPRTRVGCDVRSLAIRNIERQFQSTHPRGVRLTTHFKFL